MKLERALRLLVIGAVVVGGALIGRSLRPQEPLNVGAPSAPTAAYDATFRNWLWERRSLDLLVQVALVFAGALGVAAILPHRAELETPAEPDLPD